METLEITVRTSVLPVREMEGIVGLQTGKRQGLADKTHTMLFCQHRDYFLLWVLGPGWDSLHRAPLREPPHLEQVCSLC